MLNIKRICVTVQPSTLSMGSTSVTEMEVTVEVYGQTPLTMREVFDEDDFVDNYTIIMQNITEKIRQEIIS